MRDYVTTVFNLIVGLVDADKLVYLALIGLGIILVWQLLSLLTNFHRKFAGRCRKISKFLTRNGLSADNYNNFLALVAKMPQEFIRGYKTFEHASYGLPSDYIKRFDSIDVEVNGGVLNHGKSLVKAVIYGWTIILAVLSLALLGSDAALTGFAVADALIVPVLFLMLAKIIYFIFNAIKQQQYKMAVDEFNEMLDIMDEKIENNDSLPGPDVLADLMDAIPVTTNETIEPTINNNLAETDTPVEEVLQEQPVLVEPQAEVSEVLPQTEEVVQTVENTTQPETIVNEVVEEKEEPSIPLEDMAETQVYEVVEETSAEPHEEPNVIWEADVAVDEPAEDVYTEEQLIDEVVAETPAALMADFNEFEPLEKVETVEQPQEEILPEQDTMVEDEVEAEIPAEVVSAIEAATVTESKPAEVEPKQVEQASANNEISVEEELALHIQELAKERKAEKTKTQENKEDDMEEKRGRGRPKKVAEGELVIKNDKQFEEVLQRAEKLMRKSEEALSSSQAKRVEKSLKELIDAMTKYKEEH